MVFIIQLWIVFIAVFTNNFVASSCAQKLYCIVGIFDGGESLVNLVNHLKFDKLKSSKLVVTINNLLADLFIHQTYITKVFIHPLSPNIIAAKLPTIMIYTCTRST